MKTIEVKPKTYVSLLSEKETEKSISDLMNDLEVDEVDLHNKQKWKNILV